MAGIGKKEIDRRFEAHPVSAEQKTNIEAVTAKFKTLASWIDKNCADNGREAASALTHLEQAKFFAVAALSRPTSATQQVQVVGSAPKAAAPAAEKVDGRSAAAKAAKAAAAAPAEAPAAPVKKGPRRPIAK